MHLLPAIVLLFCSFSCPFDLEGSGGTRFCETSRRGSSSVSKDGETRGGSVAKRREACEIETRGVETLSIKNASLSAESCGERTKKTVIFK